MVASVRRVLQLVVHEHEQRAQRVHCLGSRRWIRSCLPSQRVQRISQRPVSHGAIGRGRLASTLKQLTQCRQPRFHAHTGLHASLHAASARGQRDSLVSRNASLRCTRVIYP